MCHKSRQNVVDWACAARQRIKKRDCSKQIMLTSNFKRMILIDIIQSQMKLYSRLLFIYAELEFI